VEEIPVTNNLPLGLCNDWIYQIEETTLRPGDKLLFYTDGITEAHTQAFDEFGVANLLKGVQRFGREDPETLVRRVVETVLDFTGNLADPHDDQTILVVDYGAKSA
jgi:serine phosphatase RsbU (regulator of sigma subunit)